MEVTPNGAIYLRLSREERHQNESESITNQRLLLLQYASAHAISVAYEFADDGVTGTTQNRKGLQGLYQAIEDGLIDTVLVKDLSRLSRNYIQTGELIEEWFPAHGVRLISVDDGIDTRAQSPSNDIFAIRAVMDDWYARDISRKVRAAIYAKQHAGFCTSPRLPFGYQKKNGSIEIYEAHANIVRQIFDASEQGMSYCKIARELNHSQISEKAVNWNDTTIRRILRNTTYTGKMLLHITEKASYKSSRRIRIPAEQNVILPVPRIISDQQFENVQRMNAARAKTVCPKHWLSGRVFCAVCGANIHVSGAESDGRLICSNKKRFHTCTAPSMHREELLDMIYGVLQKDSIPVRESVCRRMVSSVRIAPDCVTICMRYRKPGEKNAENRSGTICELSPNDCAK